MPGKGRTPPDFYYSPEQAAEILGVSRRTIYNWLRTKKMDAIRLGPKLWRISQKSLNQFVNPAPTK